jgi:chromosome segregation ATPase
MNMKLGSWFTVMYIASSGLLYFGASGAQAEIYKAVDRDGHVTYSSSPIKGGKKLILEPLPTMMPPGKVSNSEGFPKVNNQRERDDTRQKILQDELNAEEKLLEEAQQNLTEGESQPEVFKGSDGRTYRNVAKYEEKIKPLQEQVDLHKNNIEALKTELSKLAKY